MQATRIIINQDNCYDTLYRKEGDVIVSLSPMSDSTFKREVEFNLNNLIEGFKHNCQIIHLPENRLFVIGGASDPIGFQTTNRAVELEKDEITCKYYETSIQPMHVARASFGVAVYPNFS